MDDDEASPTAQSTSIEGSEDPTRVGQSFSQGHGSGHSLEGSSVTGAPGSPQPGTGGETPQTDGHHLRERHPERVPRPEDIDALQDRLVEAFTEGDPAKAWEISQDILRLTRELVVDSSKLRFKINFGTARCSNCTGLKAGLGVVATCYQVQQCFYSNIRDDNISPKQARILDLIGKKST